jgi:hypothetical protein
MYSEPLPEESHEKRAEKRQQTLSQQNKIIMALTVGGWLIGLGWYQATISDHGRRLDAIEQHEAEQQKIMVRVAERVGAKTD